jgi:flagellar assembly factor FliW
MAPDPRNITINLQGPIALNPARMIAKQLVMDEKYPSRHPLFAGNAAGVPVGKGEPAPLSVLREGLGTVLNICP